MKFILKDDVFQFNSNLKTNLTLVLSENWISGIFRFRSTFLTTLSTFLLHKSILRFMSFFIQTAYPFFVHQGSAIYSSMHRLRFASAYIKLWRVTERIVKGIQCSCIHIHRGSTFLCFPSHGSCLGSSSTDLQLSKHGLISQ